jgi:4-amino-4-deoxy-L-arabinose transferase-like glycosyltransferase
MDHILYFLINNIPSIGLFLIFIIAAHGWGISFLKLLRIKRKSSGEDYFYSIIIGIGIFGHLILIIGMLKLLYPIAAIILMAAGILLFFWNLIRNRTLYVSTLKITLPTKNNWFSIALLLTILSNLGYSLFANALIPPLNIDEVAYHMAVPKIYVTHHAISYVSTIPYSNWPFETEMIYTFGLLLSSETFAHLMTWFSLLAICLYLWFFGKKYFTRDTGLIAAAIFSSTPLVLTLTGTGLIELPLTMYIVLATFMLLEWLISGDKSYFILSGIFGGLAASTKLNAAVIPVILGICIIIHGIFIRHYKKLTVLKQFSGYGFLSFSVVLPWYLKTFIQTGNPFWPFLWNFLGGKNWDMIGTEYLLDFIKHPNLPITLQNWILGLWKITTNPSQFGSFGYDLSWIYLILLPLPVVALIWYKSQYKQIFVWLCVLSVIFYTNWFLQTQQTRFLMPALGIFSLVTGIGISWFFSVFKWKWNIFFPILFIVFLVANNWIVKSSRRSIVFNNLYYLSGSISRNKFLEDHVAGYKVFEYINENLPDDANIWLALYEVRGYYLDRNYLWANPISQRALRIEQFQDAGQLAGELNQRGISYVLLQTSTIDQYQYIKYGNIYSTMIRALLEQHGELIYSDVQELLYRLNP